MFARRTKGRVHYNIRSISLSTKNRSVMSRRGGGGGLGKRRGLGPTNDVLTTCKAVNPRANQLSSKVAVCFLMISTLALSVE